jgi:hypothetical protein
MKTIGRSIGLEHLADARVTTIIFRDWSRLFCINIIFSINTRKTKQINE